MTLNTDQSGASTTGLLRAVDAVQVPVRSLEEGIAFYVNSLGQSLSWRTDTEAGLSTGASDTEIVLTTLRAYEVNWLVESVEEAVAVFTDTGGSVDVEPFDIEVGRVAVVRDPFDNPLVLIDLSKGLYVVDDDGFVTGVS